jgi:hypothetical protein
MMGVGRGMYLIDNIAQDVVLRLDAQLPRLNHVWAQGEEHHGVIGCAGGADKVATRVDLSAHGFDVLAQSGQDVGLFLEDGDGLAGGGCEERGQGSRVRVRSRRDALVLYDFFARGAEAAGCAQGAGEGADDHVNFGGVDVLRFRDAAAGSAEDAVGPRLVEDQAELVLELELDLRLVSVRTAAFL